MSGSEHRYGGSSRTPFRHTLKKPMHTRLTTVSEVIFSKRLTIWIKSPCHKVVKNSKKITRRKTKYDVNNSIQTFQGSRILSRSLSDLYQNRLPLLAWEGAALTIYNTIEQQLHILAASSGSRKFI